MKYSARISGIDGLSLGQVLRDELIASESHALGVVSAFVSVSGLRSLVAITQKRKSLECRLLAGIDGAITHPQALTEAMNAGWKVRLGSAPEGAGIFHAKLILSGHSFLKDGCVKAPSFVYVGSSNLTHGGLHKNIECGVIAKEDFTQFSVASCFASLWEGGEPATAARIRVYAKEFANRNRRRSVDDIEVLGVGDDIEAENQTYATIPRRQTRSKSAAIPENAARAAWAGLESFTGEYRFQVEFPQAAGSVLRNIIRRASDQSVPILCTGDGAIREMTYRFYTNNGMFRLNIPNETPGVELVRRTHSGIALVEYSDRSDVAARLTILPPGDGLDEAVRRSLLFGTWGSTPTRIYGWY